VVAAVGVPVVRRIGWRRTLDIVRRAAPAVTGIFGMIR
jgi:hypothetical protein